MDPFQDTQNSISIILPKSLVKPDGCHSHLVREQLVQHEHRVNPQEHYTQVEIRIHNIWGRDLEDFCQ